MKKVYVHFAGDPSVGISSYGYDLNIPPFEPEDREEVRQKIIDLYGWLDGESNPSFVIFTDDENF